MVPARDEATGAAVPIRKQGSGIAAQPPQRPDVSSSERPVPDDLRSSIPNRAGENKQDEHCESEQCNRSGHQSSGSKRRRRPRE